MLGLGIAGLVGLLLVAPSAGAAASIPEASASSTQAASEPPEGQSPAPMSEPMVEPLPKIVVPEPLKEFGEVSKGARLTHDYVVENQGNADLEIRRVAPDCGCTVTEFDRVIPPGGKGVIHATIDTSSFSEKTGRTIWVYTNDPETPRLELHFVVDVVTHLGSQPGYARYQVVHGEEKPGIVRQTIWAKDGKEFKILGVDSPYPFLSTSFHLAGAEERRTDVQGTGPQWVVDLNLDYNHAPVGPLAAEVVIHTDHPKQKEVRIPITGFVRPAIWATPHEVDLGEVTLEEPKGFVIVVQSFLSGPVEITGVDSDLEGVETSFHPIQEGRKFAVEVTVDPKIGKGLFSGTVRIRTSSPKMPLVEVPLRGNVL
jgi:hypothetical protein